MQPGFQCSSVLQNKWRTLSPDDLHCQCFGHMFCIAGADMEPTNSPAENVALTIGTPLCTYRGVLSFKFIADTKLQRAKFLKPCGRTTTQFSTGLHCQARNQRWTKLVTGYLAPRPLQLLIRAYTLKSDACKVRKEVFMCLRSFFVQQEVHNLILSILVWGELLHIQSLREIS